MATEAFEVWRVLPATPERIYRAWMVASEHAEFTGAPATIEPSEGGDFEVWDGYITGTTLELRPDRLIVQAWRTTEFPEEAPDSRVEVALEPVDGGTRVTIRHSAVPEGQGEAYRQGWGEHYLDRLQEYFGSQVEEVPVMNEETPIPGAPASGDTQAAAPSPAPIEPPAPAPVEAAPISASAQALAEAVAINPVPEPPQEPAAKPAKRKAAAKKKPAKKKAKRPAKKVAKASRGAKAKRRAPARKSPKKKVAKRGAKRR